MGILKNAAPTPAGRKSLVRRILDNGQTPAPLADELPRCNRHRPHAGLNAQTPINRLGLSDDKVMRLSIQPFPIN